jgi:hypothetical protein
LIADGKHYYLGVWQGLHFTKDKREFDFDEIPGIKQAGWSRSAYMAAATEDCKTFY